MKTWPLLLTVFLRAIPCGFCADVLTLKETIALPGVEGRIDHLAVDEPGHRLFIAALGNNTVEVVDLTSGKHVRSLVGFAEPQGAVFVEESQRLYVANGGDGTLRVWNAKTMSEIANVNIGDDADNVRYDASLKRVSVGFGSGALAFVDASTNRLVETVPLHGHPESFQLETDSSRAYVNVPGAREVAVVDLAQKKQIASWSLGFAAANYPLALDQIHHRAFVACRLPARILVFDTKSGAEAAKLEIHGDCDDVFYDRNRGLVFASCGEGFVDVIKERSPDEYVRIASIKTESKARTSLWTGDRLYVAVPRKGGENAHLLVYSATPVIEMSP